MSLSPMLREVPLLQPRAGSFTEGTRPLKRLLPTPPSAQVHMKRGDSDRAVGIMAILSDVWNGRTFCRGVQRTEGRDAYPKKRTRCVYYNSLRGVKLDNTCRRRRRHALRSRIGHRLSPSLKALGLTDGVDLKSSRRCRTLRSKRHRLLEG